MTNIFNEYRFLVLTGNYGSGKTEIALNTVLEYATRMSTTIVDLDIVNPYFRSGDSGHSRASGRNTKRF